jgi:hypothetical protein
MNSNSVPVQISLELYNKIEQYANECIPDKTAEEITNDLIELGISAIETQLKAALLLKMNCNTQ